MKIGYNTWSTPMLSLEQNINLLSRIGYDSIELTVCEGWPTDAMLATDADVAEWRRQIAGAGLHLSSITGNASVVVPNGEYTSTRERLLRAFDVAAALQETTQQIPVSLGANGSIAGPPGFNQPLITEDFYKQVRPLIVDRFSDLAEEAGARGVRVALEPHVAAIVCNAQRALDILDGVDSPHLGLNLDISHFAVQGINIADTVAALAPHALVCEVKDQIGVHPDFDFLIPGEGHFDYTAFITELQRAGFAGSISVEVSLMRQRGRDYDPIGAAEQSYKVLTAAFQAANIERF